MRSWCNSLTLVAAALVAASAAQPARADVLYIGEAGVGLDTVKRFNAANGILDAGFSPTGLLGPQGMVIDGDRLLVVNQNVNTHLNGEVLSYDAATGASLGAVVAEADKDAPYSPRSVVLGPSGDDMFVGNFTTAQGKSHGTLLRYDLSSGVLLSNDTAKGYKNHDFHPRGIVFGPDGMLYVASPMDLSTRLGGAVLRFNADGTFADVFINDENDAGAFGHLNRPDGIVFGPDGNLYVTSFQAAPGDGDGIRVYDEDGDFLRRIDYYDPNGGTRVFAQALLFGPEGKLYVPMTSTGEVRVYDVTDDTFTTFGTGTDLVTPGYLTFGQTNPSTLAYGGTSAGSRAVPEPASIALAAFACVGLFGCAGAARRR